MLLSLIYRIQQVWNEEIDLSGDILIIDIPVYQPISDPPAPILATKHTSLKKSTITVLKCMHC